ncbi:MAG: flagellar motor switch protein FliG [bacterium]|nr:flagellar motor switch protein FliG [Myxococcales bacterium]MCB9542172.1 flagellar motor switch protein FliG [Myxococcales bacterium]MCB9553221.1 flagellar motor switch protein FliG [Myxococcales bacterium]
MQSKAALVLLMLGEETAGEVFKRLDTDAIRLLSRGMNEMGQVSDDERAQVLEEFYSMCVKSDPLLLTNGAAFLNALAEKFLDAEENKKLQDTLKSEKQTKLALDAIDSRVLANLIRKEHPQTIALILAYSEPAKSAEVLSLMPVETQVEVCLRMASLDKVNPQTLKDVESALMSEMKGLMEMDEQETSGVVLVAEILNTIEKSHEERIFEQLMEIDPELAEEIRNNMFVFDDLINLDDRGVQTLLKEVDNQTLILALKTADEVIRNKIFNNLSQRAVEMLKEDMEVMGPTKLSDVEKAQTTMTQVALRLEAEGKIVIAKPGGEDEFV